MLRLRVFLTAMLIALPLSAQLTETIEVRVANVDVVVTDRAGNPITGLSKADFEIFENGKLVPVTNFYEVRGETPAPATAAEAAATPAAPPSVDKLRRSIVIFIDNSSIEPFRRNQALLAVDRALEKLMRPDDDAMLVNWNRRTEVLQPFTGDKTALKRALELSRKRMASAATLGTQRMQVISYAQASLEAARAQRGRGLPAAYADSLSAVRSYAEWVYSTEKSLLSAVNQMIATLSGLEGKKILVFVGGDLQEHPGLDVFQVVDGMYAQAGLKNISPAVIRESERRATPELAKVARTANSVGVTLYMIDVASRDADASMSAAPNREAEFTAEANTFMSMSMLASQTGGAHVTGTRNFDLALDRIARDLGSYYSLGYKPSDDAAGDRRIAVKVRRDGATVRSRRAVTLRTTQEQMEDRAVANVFHEGLRGDFPVTVTIGALTRGDRSVEVPLTVTFPAELTYLPEGEEMVGEFHVYFVTASPEGALSPVGREVQPVRFAKSASPSVLSKPFTYSSTLLLRPGKQTISVVVVDRVGGRSGSARVSIDAK